MARSREDRVLNTPYTIKRALRNYVQAYERARHVITPLRLAMSRRYYCTRSGPLGNGVDKGNTPLELGCLDYNAAVHNFSIERENRPGT